MTSSSASLPLTQAFVALEEQRSAMVEGNADALQAAGDKIAKALSHLRSVKGALSEEDLARLKEAATALDINAALLGHARASNQRALNTFFEPAATYGVPGQPGLATPSRNLRSA